MDQTAVPDVIYQLYDLQQEFALALDRRSWSRRFRDEMEKKLRTFNKLFKTVSEKCRGYLGGEDVLQSIEEIRNDVKKRIGNV
ncbi:hypothetical protein A2635_01145 [Candidatus Peribacteria bacterium RIFCSPHIGHO2_01_FULL_51_9]|nr:MAG: hypothetical protein A2635_01145 [Candidatus Peribacteria bacterium RIFCSPHIGHO2_01_FULL_51_9]